jgi:serine/threonine protein kinase/tetratricopeptide (TPR) repeat protein
MTVQSGTRLGPYEILAPLGTGGMGEVYRARDTRLGREVAVKVLPERIARDEEALARFGQEARMLAALSHPNILALHDIGHEGGVAFAVMELLEGETLREALTTGVPPRKAVSYAVAIAEALTAAHEKGIVHRDLKPENVFLTKDGSVKVLDFGLAKPHQFTQPETSRSPTSPVKTEPGAVLGTIGYMSPEQVRGADVDPRADLFALGSILYEMLARRRAFQRDSSVETMMAILSDDPPVITEVGRSITPELERVVRRCLEKRPEERFQSARDLAFALREAELHADSAMGRGATPATETRRTSVAVLPFRNLSSDKEADYFSEGMTEEILTGLSRIEGLRVASRTSSFSFRGRDEDVRRIGVALGVSSVLEGSVRRAGNRLRVAAQLVDVSTGYQLWSERYDREMEDVFAVQDEIASAIAHRLEVRLLGSEQEGLVTPGTSDIEAYNLYLEGRYHFGRRRPELAVPLFKSAVARDPKYAAAYTGLSDAYCSLGFYGGIDTREAWALAGAAAEKAQELEPDSAQVAISLGIIDHYYGWNAERQDKILRRAEAAAPRSADPFFWRGLLWGLRGFLDEGLEATRRAATLEPHSANARTAVGWCFFQAGRTEDAIREYRHAMHLDPGTPFPYWSAGVALLRAGQSAEAVGLLERSVDLTERRQTLLLGQLAAGYAMAGRPADAERVEGEIAAREKDGRFVPATHRAFIAAGLGRTNDALSLLEQGLEERNALFWSHIYDPFFEKLREEPRWKAVAAESARTMPRKSP